MRFYARRTFQVWPFRFTINQNGRVTWGLKVWRWSWSASTGRHTFDTPGPGYVRTTRTRSPRRNSR